MGVIHFSYTEVTCFTNPIVAKAATILVATKLARDAGLLEVVIEGDATNVLTDLAQDVEGAY